MEVQDGTFRQEPGSGVSGIVQGCSVAVGNLEWVHLHSQSQSASQQPSAEQPSSSHPTTTPSRHAASPSNSSISHSDVAPLSKRCSSSVDEASPSNSSTDVDNDSMQERQNSNGGASSSQASGNSGLITVYVGVDGKLAGSFKISDQLRSDAAATIRGLQQQGLDAILLSGVLLGLHRCG